MVASNVEFEEILRRVATWPTDARLRLACQIIQTAEAAPTEPVTESKTRGYSSQEMRGMLATDNPPPDDAECRKILEDELIRKYS